MQTPSPETTPRTAPPDAAPAKRTPRLSIVVTTRNDNHGGNMRHRFQVFLDHLGEVCDKVRLDAELVVVEWNPDPQCGPLRGAMRWPRARHLRVRVVTVPPRLHNAFGNADKFPLFQMIAKNVGIRRAEGEYLLCTNVDVLFSEELAGWLARGDIDPGCVYRIDRSDVGATAIPEGLDLAARLAFCRDRVVRVHGQYGTHAPDAPRQGDPDKLHTEACGDFTLMSRKAWLDLRGYPEFHLWSIYLDGLLLHAARASGMPQVVLRDPLRLYHIEHASGWAVDQTTDRQFPCLDYHAQYLPLCRAMLESGKPLAVNAPDWGLAAYRLEEWSPGRDEAGRTAYRHWIDILAYLDNRLYYRDQTQDSLAALENLAREFAPTVIVELGTLGGLSLRAWERAAPGARIVAVDLSFATLRESTRILPLDLSRVTLLEQDILGVDFPALWGPDDRVLFFVDAHDLPGVPIMRHVLETAVPALPHGSQVVVDDLWHSPERLSQANAPAFLEGTVSNEIDVLQCFEGHYAPYHGGGSFLGFREVVPLLEFVNAHGIELVFDGRAKNARFTVGPFRPVPGFDPADFAGRCGMVPHNPLEGTVGGSFRASAAGRRVASIYRSAGPAPATELLVELAAKEPSATGLAYALAVCQARMGRPGEALRLLDGELAGPAPHPRAAGLRDDLTRTFLTHRDAKAGRRKAGLTLFAMPKPFAGHVADIQRNAIESWTRLSPRPEIILFGDEPGIAAIAAELGLRHVPEVGRNDYATPLVDALFGAAQELSDTDILAYVNADIVLFDDFPAAVDALRGRLPEFLMVGRRFDHDQPGRIDFQAPDWAPRLRRDIAENAILHAETGLDYFVFTPGLWPKIPPFAIGRTAWDNWLTRAPHDLGKAVVDATAAVTAVHQTHDYAHKPSGKAEVTTGIEARRNQLLCGPIDDRGFTCGATWALGADGSLARRAPTAATFGSPSYKAERLAWLLGRIKKAVAAGRPDLARAHLEEGTALAPDNEDLRGLGAALASRDRSAPDDAASLQKTSGGPRASGGAVSQPRPDDRNAPADRPLRLLQVHTFYPEYQYYFYSRHPHLLHAPFAEQMRALHEDGFSAVHMLAPHLGPLGYEAGLVVANNPAAQHAWAFEQGLDWRGRVPSPEDIVRAQIEAFRPDVLYLSDPITFDSRFVRTLSRRPRLVLGWRAANIPHDWDPGEFDLILSCLDGLRRKALEMGARDAAHFHPGFPDHLFRAVKEAPERHDVGFCGQVNGSQYPDRIARLHLLADACAQGRFGLRLHLSGRPEVATPLTRAINTGPVFGLDMYRALRESRVVFDVRGSIGLTDGDAAEDMAGRETANMRIFEATGVGAFLLTQRFDNLSEYFEPGSEIETYGDDRELLDKIDHYLKHEDHRREIAARGLARCRRDHSMRARIRDFDALIRARLGEPGNAPGRPPEITTRPDPTPHLLRALDRFARLGRENPALRDSPEVRTLAEEAMGRCRELGAKGRHEELLALTIRIKALRQPLRGLDLLRAQAFLGLDQLPSARESLKEELRLFPDNPEAAALLAKFGQDPREGFERVHRELDAILPVIRPHTMVVPAHLEALFSLARRACQEDLPGDFVECGVAGGGTSALLAHVISVHSRRPRLLHCFDTFTGMPDPGEEDTHQGLGAQETGWGAGTCAAPVDSLLKVCDRLGVGHLVRPVQGLFADTLPAAARTIGPIALLHMDGDWYGSTMDILVNLYDQVIPGGYIQIDDFGFWAGCRKAVEEFARDRGLRLDCTVIDDTGVWLRKP